MSRPPLPIEGLVKIQESISDVENERLPHLSFVVGSHPLDVQYSTNWI